jgi:hypothetical protein
MATLTAHLRCSEDHGRLPFHPDCPVCRAERLSGTLPTHGLVGRRTQAVMVAGILAASTTSPTAAVAQEADQVTEGAVEPGQSGGDSAATDLDPGGDADDLPFVGPEVSDTEAAPESDDAGPLEPEPVSDIDAPVADVGDESEPEGAPVPGSPPAVEPPSSVAPAAAPPPQVHELSGPGRAAVSPRLELEATVKRERPPRPQPSAPTTSANHEAPARAPAPAVTEPTAHFVSAAPRPKSPATKHEAGSDGARYHVVAAGESLWSIARDELGGGGASPARIAREVNRLWGLNSARIATGDPDLLRVGTKLALE